VKVLPVGIAMGMVVLLMIPITDSTLAVLLLIVMGAIWAAISSCPMKRAVAASRPLADGAGRSIAVLNFNENLSIFAMLACMR